MNTGILIGGGDGVGGGTITLTPALSNIGEDILGRPLWAGENFQVYMPKTAYHVQELYGLDGEEVRTAHCASCYSEGVITENVPVYYDASTNAWRLSHGADAGALATESLYDYGFSVCEAAIKHGGARSGAKLHTQAWGRSRVDTAVSLSGTGAAVAQDGAGTLRFSTGTTATGYARGDFFGGPRQTVALSTTGNAKALFSRVFFSVQELSTESEEYMTAIGLGPIALSSPASMVDAALITLDRGNTQGGNAGNSPRYVTHNRVASVSTTSVTNVPVTVARTYRVCDVLDTYMTGSTVRHYINGMAVSTDLVTAWNGRNFFPVYGVLKSAGTTDRLVYSHGAAFVAVVS